MLRFFSSSSPPLIGGKAFDAIFSIYLLKPLDSLYHPIRVSYTTAADRDMTSEHHQIMKDSHSHNIQYIHLLLLLLHTVILHSTRKEEEEERERGGQEEEGSRGGSEEGRRPRKERNDDGGYEEMMKWICLLSSFLEWT